MSTETQPQVIEFSFHVKDVAKRLMECPGCPEAIFAIYRSRRGWVSYVDVVENIADECGTQAVLKAASIIDDESAIAYMEKVRPILEALAAQVAEVKERCNAEIGNLLSGVTEEFWRSL